MNDEEKDKLIRDLCQCLRVYRATSAQACRLIGKRKDWRSKKSLPQDSLLDEVWDESHDAIVGERAAYNRYRLKDKSGELRRIWFGIDPRLEEL